MTKSPAAIPPLRLAGTAAPGCRSPFCLSAPRRRGRRTMSRPFRKRSIACSSSYSDLERQVYNGQAPAGGRGRHGRCRRESGGPAAAAQIPGEHADGADRGTAEWNPAALRPHGQNVAGYRLPPERSGAWAGGGCACRRGGGGAERGRSAAAAEPAAGPADAAAAAGQSQSALDAVVPGARDPGNADPKPIAIGKCPAGAGCCGDGRRAGRDGPHRRDHPAARQFGRGPV